MDLESDNRADSMGLQPSAFDNYKSIEPIGSGGYAIVYKVQDKKTKKFYAMKICELKYVTPHTLKKESEKLLKLKDCPYICQIHDSFQIEKKIEWALGRGVEPQFCVVMEYYEKGDLKKRIESAQEKKSLTGNPREDELLIIKWMLAVVEGVSVMHEHKIAHRDLKPGNIFLDDKDQIIIGDFGIAVEETIAHTPIGTIGYYAPEICTLKAAEDGYTSIPVDLWAIGCLLLDLLTLSFALPDRKENRARTDKIPPHYSTKWAAIVCSLLIRNPTKRPSAIKVAIDIMEIQDSLLLTTSISPNSDSSKEREEQEVLITPQKETKYLENGDDSKTDQKTLLNPGSVDEYRSLATIDDFQSFQTIPASTTKISPLDHLLSQLEILNHFLSRENKFQPLPTLNKEIDLFVSSSSSFGNLHLFNSVALDHLFQYLLLGLSIKSLRLQITPLIANISAAQKMSLQTPVHVCVVGTMKSGKSTFINSLVGIPLLPVMSGLLCTRFPVRVMHVPDSAFAVPKLDLPIWEKLNELVDRVTAHPEIDTPTNDQEVEIIRIQLLNKQLHFQQSYKGIETIQKVLSDANYLERFTLFLIHSYPDVELPNISFQISKLEQTPIIYVQFPSGIGRQFPANLVLVDCPPHSEVLPRLLHESDTSICIMPAYNPGLDDNYTISDLVAEMSKRKHEQYCILVNSRESVTKENELSALTLIKSRSKNSPLVWAFSAKYAELSTLAEQRLMEEGKLSFSDSRMPEFGSLAWGILAKKKLETVTGDEIKEAIADIRSRSGMDSLLNADGLVDFLTFVRQGKLLVSIRSTSLEVQRLLNQILMPTFLEQKSKSDIKQIGLKLLGVDVKEKIRTVNQILTNLSFAKERLIELLPEHVEYLEKNTREEITQTLTEAFRKIQSILQEQFVKEIQTISVLLQRAAEKVCSAIGVLIEFRTTTDFKELKLDTSKILIRSLFTDVRYVVKGTDIFNYLQSLIAEEIEILRQQLWDNYMGGIINVVNCFQVQLIQEGIELIAEEASARLGGKDSPAQSNIENGSSNSNSSSSSSSSSSRRSSTTTRSSIGGGE